MAQKQREVAEVAAYEMKYSNEEKWRNLLVVHKFLQLFLKTKMSRLYSVYQKTERGYSLIKQQSQVQDSQDLVTRFKNREQVYSGLLETITSYEKKLDTEKNKQQSLNKELNDLKVMHDGTQQKRQSIHQLSKTEEHFNK